MLNGTQQSIKSYIYTIEILIRFITKSLNIILNHADYEKIKLN